MKFTVFGQTNPLHNVDLEIKQISSYRDTAVIDNQGAVWGYGDNCYGAFGLGHNNKVNTLTAIPNVKAQQIAVGCGHMIILDHENHVLVCGYASSGQLGQGFENKEDVNVPIKLRKENGEYFKAKFVAAGSFATAFIDENNKLWTFGSSNCDQLIRSSLGDTYRPGQVFSDDVLQVACGLNHIVVLFSDNTFFVRGRKFGYEKGKHYGFGTRFSYPKVKSIISSPYHAALIDTEDRLWTFGTNRKGQLGLGHERSEYKPQLVAQIKVKQVALGFFHTVILDFEGNVLTTGMDLNGSLEYSKSEWTNTFAKIPNIKGDFIAAGKDFTLIGFN